MSEFLPFLDGQQGEIAHPGTSVLGEKQHGHELMQLVQNAERLQREQEEKDYWWSRQEQGYQNLLNIAQGARPELVLGREALMHMNRLKGVKFFIGCMDGRVLYMDKKGYWRVKIGIGANGRLLTPEQFNQFVLKLQTGFSEKLERDPRHVKVTYHDKCGACALFCKQPEIIEENRRRAACGEPLLTPNTAGKEIALKLMRAIGAEGDPIYVGANWLKASPHWHPERAITIDVTGTARPAVLEDDYPDTFELSGLFYPSPEHLAKELEIAIGIALDEHHGMGHRFGKKNGEQRLLVPVIEDPTDRALTDSIYTAIEPVVGRYEDHVLLIPFRTPTEAVRNRAGSVETSV